MENERILEQSFAEDVGDLLEAVGERLGSELYGLVSPVLKSASSFKSRFIIGFKRGWNTAREGQTEKVQGMTSVSSSSDLEDSELAFN